MRISDEDFNLLIKKVKKEVQTLSKTVTPEQKHLLKLIEEIQSLKQRTSLLNSEQNNILNSISSGILLTDKHGTTKQINSTFLSSFGFTEKHCVGKNVFELLKLADDSTVNKIKSFLKYLSKNKTKELIISDTPVKFKNNKSRTISFRLKALSDINNKATGAIFNFDEITIDDNVKISLAEAEKTYSTLVSNLPWFIYRCTNDKDWTMEFISEGCREITGYDPEDFINNRTVSFNDIINPDVQQQIRKHWQKILKNKKYFEFEYPIITKNNITKWVWERGRGIYSSKGKLLYLEGFITDITNRKSYESEIQKNQERMQLLVEGTPHLFFYVQNLDGMVEYISPSIKNITGYSVEQWLNQKHWFITDSPINEKAKTRTHLHLSGKILTDPVYVELQHANGSKVMLELYERPIFQNGQVVGLQGVAHDITERIRFESNLKESEISYRGLFDNVSEAIYILNEEGTFLDVNQGAVNMYGYKREELIGKSPAFVSAKNKNNMASVASALANSFKGINQQFEFWGLRKNGEEFLKDVRLYPAKYFNNNVTIAIANDITEKRKAEQLLRESEERYKLIAENTIDSITVFDLELNYTYLSPSVKKLLGYTPEELISIGFKNTLTPSSLSYINNLRAEQIELEKSGNADPSRSNLVETEQIRKDGKIIWIESTVSFIRDKEGRAINLLAVSRDITTKKIIEAKLKESEEKYRAISNLTSDYLFSTSVDDNGNHRLEWIAGSFEKITGYSFEEYKNAGGWRATLHPDELKLDDLDLQKLSRNEKVNREIRTINKNGDLVWVNSKAQPVWDYTENKLIGVFGAVSDISERKKNEESIVLMANMLDTAPGSISVYDLDGNCLYANQNTAIMHGYTNEEYNILKLSDIDSPETNKLVEERVKLIKEKGEAVFEVFHLKKDKTKLHLEVYVKLVEWAGKPALLSIGTDISERLKNEQTIKENEQRLRALINSTPDIICFKDGNGKWLEANDADLDLFDLKNVDYRGKTDQELAEYTNPIYREAFLNCNSSDDIAWVNKEISQGEEIIPKKDGTEKIYDVIKVPLFESDGTRKGLVVLGRDITERKKAINALKNERDLFSSGPVCTIIWAPTDGWPVRYVSSNIIEILGYPKEYLTSTDFLFTSLIHPDDLPKIKNEVRDYIFTGIDNFEQSYRIRHKNGNYLWFYDYTKFIKDSKGSITEIRGYLFDQSNLMTAQQVIENQKQRLANIIEGTNVGTWEWNVQTGETVFNYRWFEILGFSKEELEPISINTFYQLVHPDDKVQSELILQKHFKGELDFYEAEIRMKHKEGHWVWIQDKGKVVSRTKDKKPLMMFGTHQDITERKRSEILQNIQYKVAEAVVTSTRLTSLFEAVRNELSSLINVNNFFIALYDEKTGMLNSDVDKDEVEEISEWPAKGSMTGYVIEQKRSVLLTKNQINKLIDSGTAGMIGVIPEIWLGVPFRIGGKVIGVLVVQSYDNPNAYDYSSVEVLEIVAHELSIYIQHKRAEEETLKLSKTIIQSPVSIIITDPLGNIEYVNPKFTETSGYTFEEVKGSNPKILKSEEHSNEFFKDMWNTILSGNDWKGEILNRKKNGELYWQNAIVSPIVSDEGKIINFVAVNEDITDKKRMIEELILAKEKAEEMNKIKSNFFANMSHELRTPMVGILGFSEMLMGEFKDNLEYFNMVKSINASGQRLLETLNLILNLSKLEAAKVEPNLKVLNIIPSMIESFQFFESAAAKKNLSYLFKFEVDEILCEVDTFLFQSVLNNLINNAIKFTTKGGIKLTASISNNYATINVSDTGVGISTEKQNLIWEEFRQASEGYNRSFEGTGLGLTIARRYTELMKGTISVKSNPDGGTTFSIMLPITKIELEPQITLNDAIEITEKIIDPVNAEHILYVEDDEIAVKYVRTITKNLYKIDNAKDSDEALELLDTNKYKVILMDINLHHGMDGIELSQLIRKMAGYKDIPIIALTAFAMGHEKEEFLSKGMSHYLSKPFSKKQLLDILNNAINPEQPSS